MRGLPLTQLRVLAAVYEAGGVRPAARELGIAHSAVSRHLHQLEAWVGAPLFEGAARRALVLTPAGRSLARESADHLNALARAVQSVRESRRSNSVTVVTTSSVAVRWLVPRLGSFAKANPGLEMSVLVNQAVSDPELQAADIGLRMGQGPWTDVTAEALMHEYLYPVLSPSLWEKLGRPTDPAVLRKVPLLHDRDSVSAWSRWLSVHPVQGLDPRPGSRFGSSDLLLRAAVQGVGAALARHQLARDDIDSGILVRPFSDRVVEVRDAYWLVTGGSRPHRSAVAKAAEWLRAEARSLNEKP